MSKTLQNSKVINSKSQIEETLDWVGIDAMTLPVQYKHKGHLYRTAAILDLAVSLDKPDVKGIDMAELYFKTQEHLANKELDYYSLNELSKVLLNERSYNSRIEVSFDVFCEQKALRSGEQGWRSYPLSLELVNIQGETEIHMSFQVLYASACPCSEAASRKENLSKFEKFFEASTDPRKEFANWYLDPANGFAHPHAQKSQASFSLNLVTLPETPVDFAIDMIKELEDLIQSPVYSAVREEDEAAFTTKMGENLIFIEDAARKFKHYIKNHEALAASTIELIHNESIHPHNAKVFLST